MTKTEKLTAILQGARFRRKGKNSYYYVASKNDAGISVYSHFYSNARAYQHEGFIEVESSQENECLILGTSIVGKSAYVDINLKDLELL